MDQRDKSFSPETVDEQIEQFLGKWQSGEHVQNSSAEVVQVLQGIYQENPRLRKVWERLVEHLPAEQTKEGSDKKQNPNIVHFPQKRVNNMQTSSLAEPARKRNPFPRHLGLLAAIILAVVLVSSMALVLHATHQSTVTGSGGPFPPTPTPVPVCASPVATDTAIAANQKRQPMPTPSPCSTPPANGAPTPTPTPANTPISPTPTPPPPLATPPPTPMPTPTPPPTPTPTPAPPSTPTPTPAP